MSEEARSLLASHSVDVIYDNGFEDDPGWKIVCSCGWETWGHGSEEAARTRHRKHAEGTCDRCGGSGREPSKIHTTRAPCWGCNGTGKS